jgi:hypothetical protein
MFVGASWQRVRQVGTVAESLFLHIDFAARCRRHVLRFGIGSLTKADAEAHYAVGLGGAAATAVTGLPRFDRPHL